MKTVLVDRVPPISSATSAGYLPHPGTSSSASTLNIAAARAEERQEMAVLSAREHSHERVFKGVYLGPFNKSSSKTFSLPASRKHTPR